MPCSRVSSAWCWAIRPPLSSAWLWVTKSPFVAPEVTVTPAGMFPRLKRFTVVGIFHVGAGEIDGHLALTHVQDLARLQRWQPDQVQGIRLKFADSVPGAAYGLGAGADPR